MNRTVANLPSSRSTLGALGLAIALCLLVAEARPVQSTQAADELTAMFANANQSGNPVTINVLRWSTDQELDSLFVAMDPVAQAAAEAAAEAAAAAEGRGGRGGGGGRGGRGGGADAPAEPEDPIAVAISEAETVGYVWTNSAVGYAIKYARVERLADGGERIVLVTGRRLAPGTPAGDESTLTEIRLNASGSGEGRSSVLSQAAVNTEGGSVALSNYDAASTVFVDVQR